MINISNFINSHLTESKKSNTKSPHTTKSHLKSKNTSNPSSKNRLDVKLKGNKRLTQVGMNLEVRIKKNGVIKNVGNSLDPNRHGRRSRYVNNYYMLFITV